MTDEATEQSGEIFGAIAVSKPTAGPSSFSMLRRRAGGVGLLRILSGGLGFITTVTLARMLGQAEYGYYALALAWATFLSEPAMQGLGRLLVRTMSKYAVQEQWGLTRGLLLRLNQLVITFSLVTAAVGCVVALLWLSPGLRLPFCIAMFIVIFYGLTVLREGSMQALGHVVAGQVPEFLIRPALFLVVVGGLAGLASGDLTASSALAINVGSVAVAYLFGALQLRRALPSAIHRAKTMFATREWSRAAIPMILISAAWNINAYVGILIVGAFAGAPSAGVFSVIQKGMAMITLFLLATNISLAPEIVRLHAIGDKLGLERAVEHMARLVLLLSTPFALALAILPGIYLSLFGDGFSGGATAMTILALAQLLNGALGPSGNVLMMTGHERAALGGVVTGLVINFFLGIALVPPLGLTGAAIASATSVVVWNSILVVLVRRRVGINATSLPWLGMVRSQGS